MRNKKAGCVNGEHAFANTEVSGTLLPCCCLAVMPRLFSVQKLRVRWGSNCAQSEDNQALPSERKQRQGTEEETKCEQFIEVSKQCVSVSPGPVWVQK